MTTNRIRIAKQEGMRKRVVYIIDFVVLVVSVVVLLFAMDYVQPLIIAPDDGYTTRNTTVLFSFEKANAILIDDNPAFSSPETITAQDNLVISLRPGIYYWKVKGIVASEIRRLEILSEVNLQLRSVGEHYEVINVGNVPLDVAIYDNENLVGNVVLDVSQRERTQGDRFEGREYG